MPAARKPLYAVSQAERAERQTAVGVGLDWEQVPAQLDRAGRAQWRHLAEQHRAYPTRLRETDRAAVIAFCSWWSAFDAAQRDIAKRGSLVPGRSSADAARGEGGLVKNPSVAAMRDASQQLRYWARELALTPDSRARQGLQTELPEDDDPDGIWDC
ncbi:phage terminase small subunit P27 family [Streptomyces pseudogriseolus]|uniref:phage terminase small subunit P27 family n=1 Tax=Streptomyces pseudogriseolus TaxID=36817 RepID=UPI003499621B